MAFIFNKNVEEKMEWAYQQFALNLVIHSLLVDHQNSADGQESTNGKKRGEELERMAEIWSVGMTIKEEDEAVGNAREFIGKGCKFIINEKKNLIIIRVHRHGLEHYKLIRLKLENIL
jgi:hypothetical protein